MKVRDLMTHEVHIASPNETLQNAAMAMRELDAGCLPVGDNDRLVGMISDRDIATRGIALGRGPLTKVRDVMTTDVKYCFEDQDLDEITKNMSDIQVRRLPVVNRQKRLVGIVSLGDIALQEGTKANGANEALCGISRPGGQHNQ